MSAFEAAADITAPSAAPTIIPARTGRIWSASINRITLRRAAPSVSIVGVVVRDECNFTLS